MSQTPLNDPALMDVFLFYVDFLPYTRRLLVDLAFFPYYTQHEKVNQHMYTIFPEA